MPTGDKQVNLFLNRLLDKTALKEQFLEFLSKKIDDGILSLTAGDSGTLDSDKVGLTSSANDTFSIDTSLARRLAVGGGQVITLPLGGSLISGEHIDVPFENATGTTYEVGVRYASVKSGIAVNARSGKPEYPSQLEDIGELGNPGSVVNDPGVKVTLNVDNLTQSGVDHSGRTVRVYLTDPVSGVESIAYYDDVIKWVGGSNVIEIPYSGADGPLGQDTSVNPPSTTAGDYVVHVKGVSWKAGTSTIFGDSDYAFIGRITGNGPGATPTAFNVNDQVAVFLITLQKAYDGIGAGAGRRIQADDGAVIIESDDSNDELGALLRLNRRTATESNPVALSMIGEAATGTTQINLVPIEHTTVLEQDEAATAQATTGQFNLTRGGVNLTTAEVHADADVVLARNFPTPSMNGLYIVSSFTSNQITLSSVHGAVTWNSGESGTLTFLRARLTIGEADAFDQVQGLSGGIIINGLNRPISASDDAALLIFPRQAAAALNVYDRSAAPRLQTVLTQDATLHMVTSGNPEGERNTQIRLSRLDNTDWGQFSLFIEEGDLSSIPIATLKPINYPSKVNAENNVSLAAAGNTVTFNDAGIDLTDGNVRLSGNLHLLLITNAFDDDDNGLYGITSITTNTLQAVGIFGGGTPSFAGGSAKARILHPTFVVGGASKFTSGLGYWNHAALFTCRDVDGSFSNPVAIMPELIGAADALRLYNARAQSLGAPEIASRYQTRLTGTSFDQQGVWKHGDVVGGNPVLCGHDFIVHPGHNADDFALNIKPGPARQLSGESFYNRAMALFNDKGVELHRLEHCGRIARPHEFFDDFFRHSAGSHWTESVSGGTVYWATGGASGGILRLFAAAGIGNYAEVYTPDLIYMRHPTLTPYRIVNLAGRFRPSIAAGESPNHLNQEVKVYLYRTSSYEVGVRYLAAGSESQFEFYATDGVTTNTTIGKGAPGSDDDESGWFKFWMRLDLESNQISVSWDHEATADSNGIDAMNFPSPTNSQWRGLCDLRCRCENIVSGSYPHAGYFDWVHVWDEVIQSGGKDRNS